MQAKSITSTSNPLVKKLRALCLKKYRDEEGLFLVEGGRHIADAVENGWSPSILAFSARAQKDETSKKIIEESGALLLDVTDDILSHITQRDNAQPLIAAFAQKYADAKLISHSPPSLWLALEEVRDPGNLGTIIRTADAAGVAGIMLIGSSCDPWSPETVRATMGSFARIPLLRISRKEFLNWRKNFNGTVLGTHLADSATDYRKAPKTLPLLLVMGSESGGLSPEVSAVCDVLAKIPMAGGTESLNLAVSTGVMLYELRRDTLKA